MKCVCYCVYVHKSNLQELLNILTEAEQIRVLNLYAICCDVFPTDIAIIKYDKKTRNISFIASDDWDDINEPTVGISYCYKPDGVLFIRNGGTQVYHNRWQFVASDYTGFDIAAAKQRTKIWNSIPEIQMCKCKIGNKKIWRQLLNKYNLSV